MSTPAISRPPGNKPPRPAGLFHLVQPYKGLVFTLAALTVLANALTLAVPKLIARAIDDYEQPTSFRMTIIAGVWKSLFIPPRVL